MKVNDIVTLENPACATAIGADGDIEGMCPIIGRHHCECEWEVVAVGGLQLPTIPDGMPANDVVLRRVDDHRVTVFSRLEFCELVDAAPEPAPESTVLLTGTMSHWNATGPMIILDDGRHLSIKLRGTDGRYDFSIASRIANLFTRMTAGKNVTILVDD